MKLATPLLRRVLSLLALAMPLLATAQTTIPVTGSINDLTGAPAPDAVVQLQLLNCSTGNATITGTTTIARQLIKLTADPSGAVNGAVWPNDLINCAGTTGATQYARTIYVDDMPVGDTLCYQVLSTQGTWNLNTQQPVACTSTPPNNTDGQYINLNVQNCLTIGASTNCVSFAQFDGTYQVDQFPGVDFGAKLQACLNALSHTYGGTCDARALNARALTIGANEPITINTPDTVIWLPCSTITAKSQVIVSPGTRNVSIHGCAYEGGSTSSGTQGGTVWVYAMSIPYGSNPPFIVGDTGFSVDTMGFHMDSLNINTASASVSSSAIAFYRTQEISLENLYLNGNNTPLSGAYVQKGIYMNGTGNYSGGTFNSIYINGFGMAIDMEGGGDNIGDFSNASTFTRLHVVCPSGGTSSTPTYGININAGDGNAWIGGDVESCYYMLHLGANAINNSFYGVRNENSNYQIAADSGSSNNLWISGGTMFTGALTDNGTRNSFLDTFHRSFNSLNGDWYGSQADATVTNHYRLGTGAGNERGLLDRYQTDYGYRWTMGLSDATAGEQFYQIQDELNNVYRISVGQYNNGQSSTNNQTVINAAGTGAVVLNGSNNAGTGGVIFGSGGSTATTVGSIDGSGNQILLGALNFYSSTTQAWQWNCASLTTCALNNKNATTPGHVFAAYTNGATDIDSQSASAVTVNNTSTGGTGGFTIYEGGANYNVQAFRVDSSGNATATAKVTAGDTVTSGNHLNQVATGNFAGNCVMSSSTTCTVAMTHSWNSTPVCHVNPQGSRPYYASYSVSSNNVTITANMPNSATWAVTCIGNPN